METPKTSSVSILCNPKRRTNRFFFFAFFFLPPFVASFSLTTLSRRLIPSSHPRSSVLQQILTTFSPKGQNPSATLGQLLRVSPPVLSAARTLILSNMHDPSVAFELLLAALDAGVVNLILNSLGTSAGDAHDCNNLEMLAVLGKISYSHDSPAPEVAKERWEGSISYYVSCALLRAFPETRYESTN